MRYSFEGGTFSWRFLACTGRSSLIGQTNTSLRIDSPCNTPPALPCLTLPYYFREPNNPKRGSPRQLGEAACNPPTKM